MIGDHDHRTLVGDALHIPRGDLVANLEVSEHPVREGIAGVLRSAGLEVDAVDLVDGQQLLGGGSHDC